MISKKINKIIYIAQIFCAIFGLVNLKYFELTLYLFMAVSTLQTILVLVKFKANKFEEYTKQLLRKNIYSNLLFLTVMICVITVVRAYLGAQNYITTTSYLRIETNKDVYKVLYTFFPQFKILTTLILTTAFYLVSVIFFKFNDTKHFKLIYFLLITSLFIAFANIDFLQRVVLKTYNPATYKDNLTHCTTLPIQDEPTTISSKSEVKFINIFNDKFGIANRPQIVQDSLSCYNKPDLLIIVKDQSQFNFVKDKFPTDIYGLWYRMILSK